MNREEAYRILGLPASSTKKEIRRAYLRKVKECHPDVGGTAEEFRKVHEAYQTLVKQNTSVDALMNMVNVDLSKVNEFLRKLFDFAGYETGECEVTYRCIVCGKTWTEKSPINVESTIEEVCPECLKKALKKTQNQEK